MITIDGSISGEQAGSDGVLSLEATVINLPDDAQYARLALVLDKLRATFPTALNFVNAILQSKPVSGDTIKKGYEWSLLSETLDSKADFTNWNGVKLNQRFIDAFNETWSHDYPSDPKPGIQLTATTGIFELITGASIAVPGHLQAKLTGELGDDIAKGAKDAVPKIGGGLIVILALVALILVASR